MTIQKVRVRKCIIDGKIVPAYNSSQNKSLYFDLESVLALVNVKVEDFINKFPVPCNLLPQEKFQFYTKTKKPFIPLSPNKAKKIWYFLADNGNEKARSLVKDEFFPVVLLD